MLEGNEVSKTCRSVAFGFLAGVLLLLPAPARAADDLDEFLQTKMSQARLPGLSVCVVRDGEILLSRACGLADVPRKTPVTPETIFILASISKTVAATALMQVYEDGRFGLDDPIGPHLPFQVANPRHPEEPITFRELLAHVSSIQDNPNIFARIPLKGDPTIPLGSFLRDYLAPGGKYYKRRNNYDRQYGPGEGYAYSNVGYGLCGYLVESITGQPFDAYCNERIFGPLKMDDARWFLRDLDLSRVAIPYAPVKKNRFRSYGQWGFPIYPCGQLRASAPQLARFLMAHMNGGEYGGARILEPSTVQVMREVQYPSLDPYYGLGFVRVPVGDTTFVGHNGLLGGARTEMYYQLETGVGVIMLTNGDVMDEAAWGEILWRLFREGGAVVPATAVERLPPVSLDACTSGT